MSYFIKVYHGFKEGKSSMEGFLNDLGKLLKKRTFMLGLNYAKGEISYSLHCKKEVYPPFESQFYTHFNDFQIIPDSQNITETFNKKTSIVAEIGLKHDGFFPFNMTEEDNSEFVFNLIRTFENFDVMNDKIGLYIQCKPIDTDSLRFSIVSGRALKLFKFGLRFEALQYIFNNKIPANWREKGTEYHHKKLQKEILESRIFLVVQSNSKEEASGKAKAIFNKFLIFKNFPLNQFTIKIHNNFTGFDRASIEKYCKSIHLSPKEISAFFQFPQNPQAESAILTVKAKKLALPVGVPTFEYSINDKDEVIAKNFPSDINILGISDYRSIRVPIGIYDEDRLRHLYVVGKTGTGKSKFLLNLMINDINQNKGIGIIDPHGDAIEELLMHIPESRKDDVIIFDPTDEQFPFCLNPLDVQENESKQILAKGFIDIFKKFFAANWNPKLEHVLRMVFLALLDKKNSTLYDIIRALTDKDFRYTMIDNINDDVVRNFWTNEFAGWSQQFNTEAIMPILNKVGQLLSIDIIKNIFASPENKLDLRKVMDEGKILLIKLPKGKLQEDIMGFLGAMFITKLFQTAMGRQSVDKSERRPFFLYVDEFQNFATETFSEILAEARKYGLSLSVAHQFVKQIPKDISEALFGNVGTMVSFRVSSDDAEFIKNQYAPFLSGYDLANLNMREFYCKLLVKGQVKDPFSLKSPYTPDVKVSKDHVMNLYQISRAKYNRTLEEAKKVVQTEIKDIEKTLEEFAEPL